MPSDPIVGATATRHARFYGIAVGDAEPEPLVPESVTLTIETPSHDLIVAELAELEPDDDGRLVFRFVAAESGWHDERWEAVQGDTTVVAQGRFYVRERNVPEPDPGG